VLFGTGKMLEPDDPADLTQQAVYATRIDGGSYPMTQSDLAQRVLSRSGAGGRYFTISGSASATTHRGWYFQLGGDARDAGERIVSAFGAHFSSGAALIGSIVPNGGDPCRGDLRGNFYILDASTGGALETGAIADSDEDGDIDGSDAAVGVALDKTAPGGTPAIIEQIGGGRARIPDLPGVELPTPTWRRRHHGEVR
jgi:Tfp pilus tip-associated adhesin PilY1